MWIYDNHGLRKDFSKIKETTGISNLIDIQTNSYYRFLQHDRSSEERENAGLQRVFRSVFPITDFYNTASLEFVGYRLGEPKYDMDECVLKGGKLCCPHQGNPPSGAL